MAEKVSNHTHKNVNGLKPINRNCKFQFGILPNTVYKGVPNIRT